MTRDKYISDVTNRDHMIMCNNQTSCSPHSKMLASLELQVGSGVVGVRDKGRGGGEEKDIFQLRIIMKIFFLNLVIALVVIKRKNTMTQNGSRNVRTHMHARTTRTHTHTHTHTHSHTRAQGTYTAFSTYFSSPLSIYKTNIPACHFINLTITYATQPW